MPATNHLFRLAARPVGLPKRSDWNYVEEPVRLLADGEILVKILYISLDPAMRGWMNDARSYVPPIGIGEVMRAGAAGRVIESKNPGFAVGDHVTGLFGMQEYAISNGQGVTKVDTKFAPLPVYISTLGTPGMTAYFGLLETGELKDGETVVVSGAAGAVGAVVGQIAKIKGCRAVGIAGGPDKCRYVVEELGFDACIDHRAPDLARQLEAACRAGIDVYFENVGGAVQQAVWPLLNDFARIPVCGLIAQYSAAAPTPGPDMFSVLRKRLTLRGFIVWDFAARQDDFLREASDWVRSGRLKYREDVVDGLENAPAAFLGLLQGRNFGKLLVKVA